MQLHCRNRTKPCASLYDIRCAGKGIRNFLELGRAVPVVVRTPYGLVDSDFLAVGSRVRIGKKGEIKRAKHSPDRIQRTKRGESLDEWLHRWYGLRTKKRFDRVDCYETLRLESPLVLVLSPVTARTAENQKIRDFAYYRNPLSFNRQTKSTLWVNQIERVRKMQPEMLGWCAAQLTALVNAYWQSDVKVSRAVDLLRAAGPLSVLGFSLGSPGITQRRCEGSAFKFGKLPQYSCHVQMRRKSSEFGKRREIVPRFPRTVLLCYDHDEEQAIDEVDVIELVELARYLISTQKAKEGL